MTTDGATSRALKDWRMRRKWSQLDLALRAGTTQRHLSYIESGRSRPGRGMLLRLAETLELSLRERNELLQSAGFAPVFPEMTLDSPELRPVHDAIHHVLQGHMPYPALVSRAHGELVEANEAFSVFTEDVAPFLLEPPVNVLRVALHPEGLAGRTLNLPQWGRHITESLRARALRSRPSDDLEHLIEELESYLPPLEDRSEHVGFAVPLQLTCNEGTLRLITTLTSFATATDVTIAELQLEAFLPADETSADILRRRVQG